MSEARKATVITWFEAEHTGDLLYLYAYPRKVADDHGKVNATVDAVQRIGLLIDGVSTHFTVPKEVCFV